MCIGHDTMYAYAGSWYDAHEAVTPTPVLVTITRVVVMALIRMIPLPAITFLTVFLTLTMAIGNMNALMGANGGNIDSGTVLPTDAISMIRLPVVLTVPTAKLVSCTALTN